MPIIKTFHYGSIIERDRGAFDAWCVYLTRPGITRYAPKDIQYFTMLRELSETWGAQNIYNDYVTVYNMTNGNLDTNALNNITEVTQKYGNDALELDILFSIIYAGMVAE